VPGPRDGARAPADSAPEQPTSSPPASGSSSSGSTDADDESPRPTVWAAARNFWPGTEDRQDEPDPPADEPDPDPEQGTYTFGGPLGAGPESNRQIWEPRRLHQVPRLRRAPRPTPSPEGTSQQGTSAQGTSQRDAAPQGPAPEPPSRPSRPGRPPHQDIPVRRLALPSGSTETPPRKRRDSRESNRAKRHRPTAGPAYAAASDYDGTARRAERSKVGDLMADNRMRIWRRRLLIAIAAGLVFSFIFTWRAGLTAAVLAAIADVIYRSRTTASMPAGGVRLTGAQKRTQRQLGHMERSGYRALHSRPIPGSREQIDHFVVGPTGAYAIDSEDWDKNLPIRTRNARQLWHGPFSKKDRLEHARWEAGQASERLSAELGHTVYVRPVLAVYGPKVPWNVATIREVDVFNGDRLRKYLRRNALLKERPRLTKDEVEQIYAAAARVLPLNNAAQHAPVG
jgi:hypothetical protein